MVVTDAARDDLAQLIRSHSLPADTPERVRRSLRPLQRLPLVGPELEGRLAGNRFLLGPWRWMILVYRYYEERDLVAILSVHDGRASAAPRGG